jgi:hypothetical protein
MNEYMIVLRPNGKLTHIPGARTATFVDRVLGGDWKACLLTQAESVEQAKVRFEQVHKEQDHG